MKSILLLLVLFITLTVTSQNQKDIARELIRKPKLERSHLKSLHTFRLDAKIPEGSGLVAWNGQLWTHNDSDSNSLFALDTATGKIVQEYELPHVKNRDWEDLSQDSDYFYLGAFGNNTEERDTLRILRIEKISLLKQQPKIDAIKFGWPETFTDGKRSKINFNCEAMAVVDDSIYLFTKEQKEGRRTRVFSLPVKPGTYTAHYKSTLNTRILVTGASYDAGSKKLVLCGYNLLLRPFLLVFPEVKGTDFFAGKVTQFRLRLPFHQIEGVSTFDGKRYYLINEKWKFMGVDVGGELNVVGVE